MKGNRQSLFIVTVLCAVLASQPLAAQLNYEFTEGKYLIKVQERDLKSEQPVPLANIWITNQKRGITADAEGRFTMYVYPSDTLRFSSLGYIKKTIPTAAIPDRDKYTILIQLVPDIYSMKTVTIYPFHNKEEFIEAFITAKGIKPISITGIDAPKYVHKEKAGFGSPISAIYNRLQRNKRVADPNFKP